MSPDPALSGFSIVRNAVALDYPVAESLRSLLPLVDELVVAVGRSDAGTLELVRALGDPRLVIVKKTLEDEKIKKNQVLAQQSNLALQRCRHRWAFYLQADEVVHEDDHAAIRAALRRVDADEAVDALTFRFVHFEGTYAYVNPLRYRRQSRLVRNDGRLVSLGDAAGFGRRDGARLRTRRSGARIFHYGWARAPAALLAKGRSLDRLYHDDAWLAARWDAVSAEVLGDVDLAFRWRGRHPAVMRERIGAATWQVPPGRRPPLDTPLLNPRFYAAWLRKWRLLR